MSGAKQEVVNLIKHDVATLKESVEEGMKLKVDREEVELRERGGKRTGFGFRSLYRSFARDMVNARGKYFTTHI